MAPKREAGQGRPTPTRPRKALEGQRQAPVRPAQEGIAAHKQPRAGLVLGPHMPACHGSDAEGLRAYTAPSGVEGGCRGLNAPCLLVSSLCGKKPRRMPGRLRGMTLAWLGDALTPRRLRQQRAAHKATRPHHSPQPTARPTLRWVCQLLDGMHRVRVRVQGQVHDVSEGLNEVQITILRLFGEEVCRLYPISPG